MTPVWSFVSFILAIGVAVGDINNNKMHDHHHHISNSQPESKTYASANQINSELLFQSIPSILPHLRRMAKPISEKVKTSNKEFIKIEVPLIMEVEANSLEPLLRKSGNPSNFKPQIKQGSAIDDNFLDILAKGVTPQTKKSSVNKPLFSPNNDIALSGTLGNDLSILPSGSKSQLNLGVAGSPTLLNTEPVTQKQASVELNGELPGTLGNSHTVLPSGPTHPNLGIAGFPTMFNTEPVAHGLASVQLDGELQGTLGNGHTFLSPWQSPSNLGVAGFPMMFNTEPVAHRLASVQLGGELQGPLGNAHTGLSSGKSPSNLGVGGLPTMFNKEAVAHRQAYVQLDRKLPTQKPLNVLQAKPNPGTLQDLLPSWQGNRQISNQVLSPFLNHKQSFAFGSMFPVSSQSFPGQTSFTPIISPSFIQKPQLFSFPHQKPVFSSLHQKPVFNSPHLKPISFTPNNYGSIVPGSSKGKKKNAY